MAATRVRYGYRRIHVLLRREGWSVNAKRVYRIYRELGLQLRNKRRSAASGQSCAKAALRTSTVLIKDGEVLGTALSAEHVSEDDLEEDLRQEGVSAASEVKEARLERSGQLIGPQKVIIR